MSNSTRALEQATMPIKDQPLSEQFRLAAEAWVDANAAADLLEETKSACLSQRAMALGEMSVAKAEMIVKSSEEWHEHLKAIVEARRVANRLKVQKDYIQMRFSEWQSADANARKERGMSR